MNNQKSLRFRVAVVLVFAVFSITSATAQTDLSQKIPSDSKLKQGKLPNGLSYFIRQNKRPEQKVELRLALNAGAINEDDDQQGLAHMAEHMAFNGTRRFKKNEIVSFLQDIGVEFGSDLNAYTGFDETVYILPIPTDKPGNLEKGFQVLEDWAHQVTYLDQDIDGERAVILEESRLGKGADDRMFRKVYPKLFHGSKYADRLPIGLDSIIKHFSYPSIRRFYKEWYRPDLMAVIVVGDIDPAAAEAMIKKHFSTLKNPSAARARTYADVPAYDKSEAIIVTDKEAVRYSVAINYPAYTFSPAKTVGEYRKYLVEMLFASMFNQRLSELAQNENPPFLRAMADFSSYARGYKAFSVEAQTGAEIPTTGLKTLVEEIERVKRYGFTEAELKRATKVILSGYEQSYNDRGKAESAQYAEEYIELFLQQQPSPGIDKEFQYAKQLLPGISLDELNQFFKKIGGEKNRMTYIMGPEPKAGEQLPSEQQILTAISETENKEVEAYKEKAIAADLITHLPAPGKVTARKKDILTGTTELVLGNGATVVLKPTDFKDDEILMGAVRAGGKNNYGLADKFNVQYAAAVVTAMGVGEFSPNDLRKALAGKSISVKPVIGENSDGLQGNSTVKDLEAMFELTHLYLTQPRRDTALFRSFIQKNKSQYANISANPQAVFIDTVYATLFKGDPLAPLVVPRSSYYDKIDLDRTLSIYRERFGDVRGMHFVFAGSFKESEIIPLIEKYIASLPSTDKRFAYADNKVRPVEGKKTLLINKGKEQKSMIVAFYTGETPYSEDLALKMAALQEILNIRIIEELREKIQGIYGGGVSIDLDKVPYANFSLTLQLPCGPEKVDTLLKAVRKEFTQIALHGPEQRYLDKVKQQWREQYKTSMKENGTWLDELLENKFPGSDPDRFIHYEKYLNKLTIKDVQDAAKITLAGNNQFMAILMPE